MVSEAPEILVVDDDPRQRKVLAEFLGGRGFAVTHAPDAETGLERVTESVPALVLMDVRMPGMGGLEGLARMRERHPTLPVILLTVYADVRDAVMAMREGAVDYLEKPIDLHELAAVIGETIGEPGFARRRTELPPLPPDFVVASAAMENVLAEAILVAPTEATVLITGESGTGKERVAEFIHRQSPRHDHPFVAVNCSAIPHALVESELFGHVKGAFTGAASTRLGRFEAAAKGTLLLDEVGELPLDLQPKLLRVLENETYERVGETATRRTDVRVVASTNRDLEREIKENRFREDLFWRLNVFRIHLPPLRERAEEIPALARCFLGEKSEERRRLSPAALRALEAHVWPGNVRELANVIRRAAILATGGVILPEHLPEALRTIDGGGGDPDASPAAAGESVVTVQVAERQAIRRALDATDGNRTKAAKLLGISRRKLIYRLKEYGGDA